MTKRSTPPAVSISQARRLFLQAQGFGDPAPKGPVTRRHLRRVMGRLQLLQLDSVPVVIRTQYMPLYARLGPYRTGLLEEMAYKHREWFECWSHEASMMPVEREPLFRWHKARSEAGGTWGGLYKLAQEEGPYVQSVYDEVVERGPISASELSDPRPRQGEWWGSRSMGLLALDWLYRIGKVGVVRDANFKRSFDLLERIVPEHIQAEPTPDVDTAQRELLMLSAQSLGVATATDLADYYRLPIREARARIAELAEDGRLDEVQVQGWDKPAFRHPEAKLPRSINARAFLSPFDPVVWHRDHAERMFDFQYKIEIYVPKAKRRYGYYVMPFLMGDRVVGRVDLKTHRDRGVLEVIAAYREDHADRGEVAAAMSAELPRLAELVGAESVEVTCRRDLAKALTI